MSRFIFAPFISVLNLLSYRWKFMVVFFIILIPIIIVMNVSIENLGEQIEFNAKEKMGVRYINSLRQILVAITIQPSDLQEAVRTVDSVDTELGPTLKATEKWQEWKEQKPAGENVDSTVQSILGLISQVGDTSNLILDPDLDSYYLMDSTVNKLPQTMYSLNKIHTALAKMNAAQPDAKQKNDLIALRTQAEILLEGETSGLQVVYRENGLLKQQLEQRDQAALSLINKTMSTLTETVIEAEKTPLNPAAVQQLKTSVTACIQATLALHELHSQALDNLIQARIDKYTSKKNAILIAFAAGIAAFLYCFLALYRCITLPIREFRSLMAKVQVGNLNVACPVRSRDEFGKLAQSFNAMIGGQREIVETVRTTAIQLYSDSQEMAFSAQQVASATKEISNHTQTLFQDASQAKQSIHEISRVLTDLTQQIHTTQGKAESAALNSQETYDSAALGGTAVKTLSQQIANIQNKTIETSNLLETLNESASQIDSITQTINGIANQTNLLALNAAIEAARAGESGRGFSVVAEEVRKLAEQSASQAAEVSLLLKKITATVMAAVATTRYSNAEVTKGVIAVDEAGGALSKIVEAVNRSVEDIDQIKQANTIHTETSGRVHLLLEDVTDGVNRPVTKAGQLSISAGEITKAIATVATGAEQTNQLALDLRNTVEKFILN